MAKSKDQNRDFRPRMWSKVDRSGGPEACWNFTGGKPNTGYGVIGIDGRQHYLHRLTYEIFIGPIPESLEIDHLCRNRACCNPNHLEAVTHAVNMSRGPMATKTHCKRGHPLSGDNLRQNKAGVRVCMVCSRETNTAWVRERRQRLRAALSS